MKDRHTYMINTKSGIFELNFVSTKKQEVYSKYTQEYIVE